MSKNINAKKILNLRFFSLLGKKSYFSSRRC